MLARPCLGSAGSSCWVCQRRSGSWSRSSRPPRRRCGATGAGWRPSRTAAGGRWSGTCPRPAAPVTLLWLKRLWRCPEPACEVKTWSETSEHIRARSSLTERARREACRLVGEDQQDVASVAVLLGVGWATVMRAVVEYGTPLVEDPRRLEGVASIGVDETAYLAANRSRTPSSSPASSPCPALAGRRRSCSTSCQAALELLSSSGSQPDHRSGGTRSRRARWTRSGAMRPP